MSIRRRLIRIGVIVPRAIFSALPVQGVSRPIFITGCARSGTTIFGTTLSKHRDISFLNEPRRLWFAAYPETDIWTAKASSRHGKLHLTAADADDKKSDKLSRLFRLETIMRRKPVLIEKLPINNFRLDFIREMFPDARFIHLYRSGLEVARSIGGMSGQGGWFGEESYKWDRLVEYALDRDDTKGLPALCTTHFDRGLLEWRLSTEAAVDFLRDLPDEAFYELNYDQLIDHPAQTVSGVLDFIGVDGDPNVTEFASTTIARRSTRLGQERLSEKERTLGGPLLAMSMDGGDGLTRRHT